jgi:hypothetical protein
MEDLGELVSYLALRDGVPVFDRDGERVGVVDRVVSDGGIFEGLIIHTSPVLGGQHLFARAEQVAELREKGVRLAVARAELRELDEKGRRRRRDAGDSPEPAIETLLRRMWDRLTGMR